MATISITEANRTGISGLIASAETGKPVTLARHGRVVAEIISSEEVEQLRQDRDTLRDAALMMARVATDSGNRTSLDDAMESFGISRSEIEAEVDAGLHTLS